VGTYNNGKHIVYQSNEPFYTSSTHPPSSPFYNKNQFFKEKRVMKGDEWRIFSISPVK
jgi:hypothetical protein